MIAMLTQTRRSTPAPETTAVADPAVAAALRDVAFVLQMTRKVKLAIREEKANPATIKA